MAQNDTEFYDDDNDAGTTSASGKGLRAQLEAALKRAGDAEQALSKLQTTSRATTIESVLKDKGVNPKVAKLIGPDVDASPDALDKWLTEYADVFNIEIKGEEKVAESTVDESAMTNYQRMQQAANNAPPPPGSGHDDFIAALKAASSKKELDAVYANFGSRASA